MAGKQIAVRVSEDVARQLKMRSMIERRSVNVIVGEAIREYSTAHPISRENMLEMVRVIAKEDESLLRVLAES